jgi:mRNA interferase MazF
LARILRGEIRWADLDPVKGSEQAGLRPIVILSPEIFNTSTNTVIAAAITSKEPKTIYPLIMEIKSAKMPKKSWVKIGQIRTLSVTRLRNIVSHISEEELTQIIDALNEIIA